MAVAAPARIRESVVPQLRMVKAEAVEARLNTGSRSRKLAWVFAAVAITVAIHLAVRAGARNLTDPEQAWFWEPSWLVGEAQANAAIAEGRYETFDSDADFDRALMEAPSDSDEARP